jgi:cytochrome b pre-mRNA-processing protein 3
MGETQELSSRIDRLARDPFFCNDVTAFTPMKSASRNAGVKSALFMLAWLLQHTKLRASARELYGRVVTRAREPTFYAEWGVADTTEGRFEMVALHLVLALDRLACEGKAGRRLARALTEAFVTDMDDAMRELGIADLTVPRKVKRAAAALFDRYHDYGDALGRPGVAELELVLQKNLDGVALGGAIDTAKLALHMRRTATVLAAQSTDAAMAGRLTFPPAV